MKKYTAWAKMRQHLRNAESAANDAVDAAKSTAGKDRAWAQALIDDPLLLRLIIRRQRLSAKHQLESEDDKERLLAEWLCSEQFYRDEVDPNNSFDGLDEDEYGGGPRVFHPLGGPRQTQEEIRGLIQAFRAKARETFSSKSELNAVRRAGYSKVNWSSPDGVPGTAWDKKEWIANLYVWGMESVANAASALHDSNWPHVVSMIVSAMDTLHSMDFVRAREQPLSTDDARKLLAKYMNDTKHKHSRAATSAIPVRWNELSAQGMSKNEAAKIIANEKSLAESTVRGKLKGLKNPR